MDITVIPERVVYESGSAYHCLGSWGVGRSKIWLCGTFDGDSPQEFFARIDRWLYPVTRDKAKALEATMPENLRIREVRRQNGSYFIVNNNDLKAWYSRAFPSKS